MNDVMDHNQNILETATPTSKPKEYDLYFRPKMARPSRERRGKHTLLLGARNAIQTSKPKKYDLYFRPEMARPSDGCDPISR